jgi:hypothetical protein
MNDPLRKYPFYVKACGLYELMWDDTEILGLLIGTINTLKRKGGE